MPTATFAALLLTAGLLAGCGSGPDCDALPALTAERDAAREDFAALVARQEAGEDVDEARLVERHDVMHDLDARTAELSTACDRS